LSAVSANNDDLHNVTSAVTAAYKQAHTFC